MSRIVVADAGPLIALARIGRIETLLRRVMDLSTVAQCGSANAGGSK